MSELYHIQVPLFALSKACTLCQQEKSIEEFLADTSKKDGYRAQCKKCLRERRLAKSLLVVPPLAKVCSQCHLEKPIEEFYVARGGPHIEQNLKPSHSVCNSRKGKKLLEEMTPYQRRGPSH